MTKADAAPRGTSELSSSDSIPPSEQAGPHGDHVSVCVGVCVCVGVGIYQKEELWEPGEEGHRGRNERHVAERRGYGAKIERTFGLVRKLT